jgi:Pathogenicity locus
MNADFMNPQKVQRDKVTQLEDLPNIGKAMATDLRIIGIHTPEQLAGKNPFQLYEALCKRTGVRHDPCVIDVFMSIVHFMDGGEARPWWSFTGERKHSYKK